jgi:hypothetical protein
MRSTSTRERTYRQVMPRSVDESVLISRFIDPAGRLITVPRRTSDRLVVYRHMVAAIEPRVDLDESAVNAALRPFGDDVAMLRRHLVDAGLLLRRPPGVYRRSDEGNQG